MKKPWLSKTLWANAIMAIFPLFGWAEKFSSDQIIMFMGLLNMVLRMVTKDKIALKE